MAIIIENLKQARAKSGLQQKELSQRSGLSQQLISQLETGTVRTTKFLPRLALALGVPVSFLDDSFEEREPPRKRPTSTETILALYAQMPPEDQERILVIAEALAARRQVKGFEE